MILSSPPAFGFESTHCQFKDNYDNDTSINYMDQRNKFKMIAYIPVLGTIYGIFRLYNVGEMWAHNPTWKPDLAHRVRHITRAIIETLSLGFLLIIPDLIVTRNREAEIPRVLLLP